MKGLFKLLIVLAIAVVMGLVLHRYTGWISISFAGWRIDLPFWVGCILLFFLFMVLSVVWRLLVAIVSLPQTLKALSQQYQKYRAQKLTQKGFVDFTTGNYKQAETALIKGAPLSNMPWLNYLHAAKAAQAQGAKERRNDYLKLANSNAPSDIATGLTQANLEFQDGQYTQSLETLNVILAKAPDHPMALKQLQQVYVALGDWGALSHLLIKLKRDRILPKDAYDELENKVWVHIVKQHEQDELESLQAIWKRIPKYLHESGDIVLIYAKALDKKGDSAQAERVLISAIKKEWREDLVELYGYISHPFPQKSLDIAEEWTKTHPNSPQLYLTLGRLCRSLELWGKSQRYFEASITLAPKPQTYAELGLLLDKMNKPELGARYFKKGLLLDAPLNNDPTKK